MLVRALGLACVLALLLAASAAPAIAAPPANDDFAAALFGAGDQLEGGGNTFGATKESGEPDHGGDPGGASVWFAWTAPRSQTVYVRVCTEGWKALLGVYRGGSVGDLQPVASARSSAANGNCGRLSFRAISTVSYRIAVDGSAAAGTAEEGNFDLTVSAIPLELPVNDSFENATTVTPTSSEWIQGSTDGSTREAGEPGHGGDLAGASVWYRWTAPSSGAMRLFPCQGGFRPALAVYAGSTLATLRSIGAPAGLDASLLGECQLGLSGVGFDAMAGETYSIEVDGADGGWGAFRLRLQPAWSAPQLFDMAPPNTYIYKLLRLRGRGIAIQFGSGGGPLGVTFVCKLDKQPFKPCATPRKWRGLAPGRHRVAVAGVDTAGNRDATPAVRTFRMGGKKR